MDFQTLQEIIDCRGEPILIFLPFGDFSPVERIQYDIPVEVAVFQIDHPSKFIVYSRYFNDQWYPNTGERYVIRELLKN